ncbi:hypothetical protein ACIHDR_44695 [Nocardia sp. NPDC052278]|uniref:hypothetical protein n=1 Tax=unclassified Nocardia TaxID=2637762 RepID=UPI0036C8B5C3
MHRWRHSSVWPWRIPPRWRLILATPGGAPREYREALRNSRAIILDHAQALVRMGLALEPRWAGVDAALLANSLLTVAEMLGSQRSRALSTGTPPELSAHAVRLMMGVPPE